MAFEIGQIFDIVYPSEAAEWCNSVGKARIIEIDKEDVYVEEDILDEFGFPTGKKKKVLVKDARRFQIVAVPEPTEEEKNKLLQAQLTATVQSVLDMEAQKLGYDNCLSACSYVDTGVTKFDDEGKSFRAWRSAVWERGYEILDEVVSGKREIPTEEELIAELPTLEIVYR